MLIAPRIEADAETCGGKARIVGTRIRVVDVLELLASDMTREEILEDFPSLQAEDFVAALMYAASQVARPVVLPIPDATEAQRAA
jgi:uncharacterized protein (DUF433 family)